MHSTLGLQKGALKAPNMDLPSERQQLAWSTLLATAVAYLAALSYVAVFSDLHNYAALLCT